MSVDALIEGDFTMATDNMQYFANFLSRLKQQVDSNMMEWGTISISDVNRAMHGDGPGLFLVRNCDDTDNIAMNGIKLEPVKASKTDQKDGEEKKPELIIRKKKFDDRSIGKLWCDGNNRIRSAFYPDNKVWLAGSGFVCELDSVTKMYIFRLGGDFIDPNNPWDENGFVRLQTLLFYEVYFERWEVNPNCAVSDFPPDDSDYCWNVVPICNTLPQNTPNLLGHVDTLYLAIARHERDLKLSQTVRNTIDNFMNENPELPFN